MLRIGCIVLSVWAGLNLAIGLGVFVALVALGQDAPALHYLFDEAERAALAAREARAVATVNSLAVLGNALIVAFCAAVLALTWRGVRRGERWALVAVAATTSFVQLAGFFSDAHLGHANLVANVVSTVVLASGLGLAAAGLRSAT